MGTLDESLAEGLRQSAAGEVVDLGSFAKYAETFSERVHRIHGEVDLGMSARLYLGWTRERGYYFQVEAPVKDVETGETVPMLGPRGYLSESASDSELIQIAFGLYKGFWEHEARETFVYRGRRVFGPHIDTNALWEVAERLDAGAVE